MPVCDYTRRGGKRLTYTIEYDDGEYFILRDGQLKKAFPGAFATAMAPHEAKADLMLHMAMADIESLNGMDE